MKEQYKLIKQFEKETGLNYYNMTPHARFETLTAWKERKASKKLKPTTEEIRELHQKIYNAIWNSKSIEEETKRKVWADIEDYIPVTKTWIEDELKKKKKATTEESKEIPKCPHENTFVCTAYCNTDTCQYHPNYN
jgi:hypothetical protein